MIFRVNAFVSKRTVNSWFFLLPRLSMIALALKQEAAFTPKTRRGFFNDADARVRAIGFRESAWEGFDMQGFESNIRDRVVSLIKALLEQNEIAAEVTPAVRLVDVGLTSMDMVNLMLSVEAEFDFTIPQDQITPENFQSVETLERMVAGQLRQAA
jgi:acyl carrier protein